MGQNKYRKEDILKHKESGTLDELFNGDGGEISGGEPNSKSGVIAVNGNDSSERKEMQGMNAQDKLGFIRVNNVLLRREAYQKTFNTEVNVFLSENMDILSPEAIQRQQPESSIGKLKSERPEVFLKVDMFVTDVKSFGLTPEEEQEILQYIVQSTKKKGV